MKYRKEQMNRIHRVEGQVRGVLRMMEQEKSCKEVVAQLSAVRSAMDRTAAAVVADNLKECLTNDSDSSVTNPVDEAVRLLVRSR
ncbi:metal-sensing transcriptional repressor [Paludifilum halophilum]|uniref:Cytoplasmic protein n=1 Tax=Paludifilum halophilum TaxID=1642702 RepID=A0A235B8A2_9BACL|nr:metal-sensing transcriptional repressor [Paludifilum halophilum]OYD08087.1 cytoplasmic protein [Paludifilum halophilum]